MSYARNNPSPGSFLTFNINDGYLEALVRGYRSGILTNADYSNLVQCDSLEGNALYIQFPSNNAASSHNYGFCCSNAS